MTVGNVLLVSSSRLRFWVCWGLILGSQTIFWQVSDENSWYMYVYIYACILKYRYVFIYYMYFAHRYIHVYNIYIYICIMNIDMYIYIHIMLYNPLHMCLCMSMRAHANISTYTVYYICAIFAHTLLASTNAYLVVRFVHACKWNSKSRHNHSKSPVKMNFETPLPQSRDARSTSWESSKIFLRHCWSLRQTASEFKTKVAAKPTAKMKRSKPNWIKMEYDIMTFLLESPLFCRQKTLTCQRIDIHNISCCMT